MTHSIVAGKDSNEFSSNFHDKINNIYRTRTFSIDFSSVTYSIDTNLQQDIYDTETTYVEKETSSSSSSFSIPFEGMDLASNSFQFSSSNYNEKEDNSRRNMMAKTFSQDFFSDASTSLTYLRRD